VTVHQVFVSHEKRDREFALEVVHALETAGTKCWIAPRDEPPGTDYAQAILDAVEVAEVMIVVVSRHTGDSRHVPIEVHHAFEHGRPIIPVRIEPVDPPRTIDYPLKAVHWFDAFPAPADQHLERLLGAVHAFLRPRTEPRVQIAPVVKSPTTAPALSEEGDAARRASLTWFSQHEPAAEGLEPSVRPIDNHRLSGRTYVKVMSSGLAFLDTFNPDGTLTEQTLFTSARALSGRWNLGGGWLSTMISSRWGTYLTKCVGIASVDAIRIHETEESTAEENYGLMFPLAVNIEKGVSFPAASRLWVKISQHAALLLVFQTDRRAMERHLFRTDRSWPAEVTPEGHLVVGQWRLRVRDMDSPIPFVGYEEGPERDTPALFYLVPIDPLPGHPAADWS
jgi:hypothetical protein